MGKFIISKAKWGLRLYRRVVRVKVEKFSFFLFSFSLLLSRSDKQSWILAMAVANSLNGHTGMVHKSLVSFSLTPRWVSF